MSSVSASLELMPHHLCGVLVWTLTLGKQKVDFIFLEPFCGWFPFMPRVIYCCIMHLLSFRCQTVTLDIQNIFIKLENSFFVFISASCPDPKTVKQVQMSARTDRWGARSELEEQTLIMFKMMVVRDAPATMLHCWDTFKLVRCAFCCIMLPQPFSFPFTGHITFSQ